MCVVPTANYMSVFLIKLLDLGSLWFCSKPKLFCAFIHPFINPFIHAELFKAWPDLALSLSPFWSLRLVSLMQGC